MSHSTDSVTALLAAGTAGAVLIAQWLRSRGVGGGLGGLVAGAKSPKSKLRGGGTGPLWPTPARPADVAHTFTITAANGFLPLLAPLRKLPAEFGALDAVLAALPTLLHDPSPQALANAAAAIPQYTISNTMPPQLLQTLMRDYSILVSAYLLEGKTKGGTPRDAVPANIAIPFAAVATALDEQWIMSYDSYCLTNCKSTVAEGDALPGRLMTYDPDTGHYDWEHLRLIRAFDGGPEEYTFIAVHFEIESNTPALIQSYEQLIQGLHDNSLEQVKAGLRALKVVQDRIIVSQLKMFNASDPRNYESFVRPWIFGWKGNADFAKGVVFEGTGTQPTQLRGETGAQSTIVPSLDIMLGITHKSDALRAMLAELEAYRPKPHRDFLAQLREMMWGEDTGAGLGPETRGERGASVGAMPATSSYVAKVAYHAGSKDGTVGHASNVADDVTVPHALRDFVRGCGDEEAVRLFNACVGQVWAFRDIHVTFSALYIGKYTTKETATGGTPYKVYLRKHRDESISHQIAEYGDHCLANFHIPSLEQFEAEVNTVLMDATANGIPPHLLERHADIIAKYGRDSSSLKVKAFPGGAEWRREAATGKVSGGTA